MLDLAVKIFVDGAVFLVGEAFAGDVEESGLTRAVRDHDFFEFGLKEAEADRDVVVVVAVKVWFLINTKEAEVAELAFDTVVSRGVAGAVGAVGAAIVAAVGFGGRIGLQQRRLAEGPWVRWSPDSRW